MNEGPQGRGRPRLGLVPLVSLLNPAHNPPQGHGCCVAPIPSLSGGGATALCPRQRAVSDDTHHRQFRQKIGERQADPGRQHCSSCSRRQNSPPGAGGWGCSGAILEGARSGRLAASRSQSSDPPPSRMYTRGSHLSRPWGDVSLPTELGSSAKVFGKQSVSVSYLNEHGY